jgi:hypothetical protein
MAYNPTDLEMVANGTGMGLMIWDLKKREIKKIKRTRRCKLTMLNLVQMVNLLLLVVATEM